ncbi:methylglyoxal synthase [Bacilliculturomica massiliensis]|nr:methylglyoxal synthase [Bacilliculturomica massiliensis]
MMESDKVKNTVPAKKRIALVAHDHRKDELIEWCQKNRTVLEEHQLCGTGTTAALIARATGLPVTAYKSGPLGGDQQIGARIAEGGIDMLIFFWDPLEAQPHDPDVKALLRIAVVYDIPAANNQSTANFLLTSPLLKEEYVRELPDYGSLLAERADRLASKTES